MMQCVEQQAFLLHSRPYQDYSYLVDLFTEYDGKVSAVAYVGKSAKNNKKAFLQPFRPLQVVLKGNNALKNLSRIESTQKSLSLTGNYLFSGFYLNELLVKLLHEQQSCALLYQQYQQSLLALVKQHPLELLLRNFEMSLLNELGVAFDFSVLASYSKMQQLDEQGNQLASLVNEVFFTLEQGFMPVVNKQQLPHYTSCFAINHLRAIENKQYSPAVMKTYKRLMRQVINGLLGNKPLNSRKFFT